ncbi:MAG TPA: DUF47 family protein [Candidatus Acidoferrum sp.]|nr:DUF47 family protein [Candidatus Acidoferrum sp.]
MFNFLPKDDKFFDQLDTIARLVVHAAEQLSSILQTFPKIDTQLQEIEEARKKADDLSQSSLSVLDHAFITPLDREDILALISGMRITIEHIAELAERFSLYPLESLYPNLTDQSRNLLELAIQVEQIMADLRQKKTLSELVDGSMKKLQAIEENVRGDRRKFLKELFRENPDPVDLLKKKDLHDLLDDAVARLIDVTQTLARVLLKNA